MIKSIVIVAIIHFVLFSLIWVGFPIPSFRERVQFYYFGPGASSQEFDTKDKSKDDNNVTVSIPIGSVTADDAWINIRGINKPKR